MWSGTAAGLRKLPVGSGCIYSSVEIVEPVSVVRNLSVWIDSEQCVTTYQELVNLAFIICAVSGRSANSLGEMSRFNLFALLCSRGSTIVTVFLRASRPLHSRLFNGFYKRPPVSWTTWRRPITWHRCWWIFTGCLSSSASTKNCFATITTYPLVTPLLTYPIYADRLCRRPIIFQAADIIQRWLCHPEDEAETWRKGVRCLCPSRMEQTSAWTQEN